MPQTALGLGLSPIFLQKAPAFQLTDLGATLRFALFSDLGVTVIGSGVDTWADVTSGVGLTANQGVDAQRPSLQASQIDGFPAINMLNPGNLTGPLWSSLLTVGAGTMFAVVRFDVISGDSTTSPYNNNTCLIRDAGGRVSLGARSTGPKLQAANFTGTPPVNVEESVSAISTGVFQIAQWRHGGGNLFARWAGQAESAGTPSGDTQAFGAAVAHMPSGLSLASMVICNTSLSAGDITKVRALLKAKYPSITI